MAKRTAEEINDQDFEKLLDAREPKPAKRPLTPQAVLRVLAGIVGFIALSAVLTALELAILVFSPDTLSGTVLFVVMVLVLAVPYMALYVWVSRRALLSDLTDDEEFRRQARRVRSVRWVGLAACVAFSLTLGLGTGLGHLDVSTYDAYDSAVQRDAEAHDFYERTYGPGGYQRMRDSHGYADDNEYFEYTYGVSYLDVVKTTVNALALGGEVFWGSLFISLLVLLVPQVISMNVLGSVLRPQLLKRHSQLVSAGGDPDRPVPPDMAALAKRVGNTKFAFVQPAWEPRSAGSERADTMMDLAQSVALTHLRMAGVGFVIFVVWAAGALVGVVFGWVD